MTAPPAALPRGFETLEPFVDPWAVDRSAERAALRVGSSADQRKIFYDAAIGLLPAALAYLDARPLEALDAGERRLMQLMLSFAHVSLAVEVQGPDETKHAQAARHLRITRAPSEYVLSTG
jgi:hypothetical protein